MNTLTYEGNLDILPRYIKDETRDLVYLAPPFKSNEDCNVFLAEQGGTRATDQFRAFDDTWVRRVSVIIAVLLWVVGGRSSGTTDAAPKPFSACSLVSLGMRRGYGTRRPNSTEWIVTTHSRTVQM